MPDLLVRLYNLPLHDGSDDRDVFEKLKQNNIIIRKPIGPENHIAVRWIKENFSDGWAAQAEKAVYNNPSSLFIAVQKSENPQIMGFACYDGTVRGFFGPTGVKQSCRGQGIGRALLLACLYSMKNDGYGYAVIGGAGPVEFYRKCCGAAVIEDSSPGVYESCLRQ